MSKEKNRPLGCEFCGNLYLPTDIPMYTLRISQVFFDPHKNEDGDSFPHRQKELRWMQICDHCLKNGEIQAALIKSNRPI